MQWLPDMNASQTICKVASEVVALRPVADTSKLVFFFPSGTYYA